MSDVNSVADAVHRLQDLIPGADRIVAAHKSELSEFGPDPESLSGVVPYTLFTEIRYYVLVDSLDEGKVDEVKLVGLYQFIEEALTSTDDMVRNGVLIRIVHKLHRHEEVTRSASSSPGRQLNRYLNAIDEIE